jgi:hypothetical protein
MTLQKITDAEFRKFGQVVEGYDFSGIVDALKAKTPLPAGGVVYVPGEKALESQPVYEELKNRYYGGLPIQIGYCNGHNTKLNALEYHRDSEVNITAGDIILLLALQSDIDTASWSIDASKVHAFFVPAGTAVELYATTLHYAPAAKGNAGFQVAVVLPLGTNGPKPAIKPQNAEDKLLFAANKWLIAHADAKSEIANGAHVGIRGVNPDISAL